MEIFTDEKTRRKFTRYFYFFSNYKTKKEIDKIIKEELSQKEIKEIKICDYDYYKNVVVYIYL